MSYRERMMDPPLVIAMADFIVAVDPETGRERWRSQLTAEVGRVFLLEDRLFVANGTNLTCFEYTSGKRLGIIELGFRTTTGFARERRLFVAGGALAGGKGAACISIDGNVLWKCKVETPDGRGFWDHATVRHRLAAKAADDSPLWSIEVDADQDVDWNAGLLLDTFVAQPDRT